MEQWNNMTARERMLVAIAGALTVAVLFYLLVVRTVSAYVQDSERELARAETSYQIIAQGAAELAAIGESPDGATATSEAVPVRLSVARAARATGVSISRIQPGVDGALNVWVESVSSPLFYRWLDELVKNHHVVPVKVNAQKSSTEGELRVQIQFAGQGG